MDEAALIPTVLYVLLTVLAVVLAVLAFPWFRATGVTVTAVALLLVLESGIAYEGVKRAMRP